ncbi:MAG: T9SS type A sorting domain-containing protein [Flavobacteriales bacterium]
MRSPMNPARSRQRALLLSLLATRLLSSGPAAAQCSVASTTGYTVNMTVRPLAIVPSNNTCQYGYNYDVRLSYAITFSGTNIPSSLYTLQGTIGCLGASGSFFDLPNNGGSGTTTTVGRTWRSTPDCNASTVASLGCNTVNIEIEGPGLSWRTVSCAFTTLPITLLTLDANVESERVRVDWTTATEANNAGFFVERAGTDGVFEMVTWVAGAGNSQHAIHYSVLDEHPFAGVSYYRLRQMDANGAAAYSNIVVVERSVNESDVRLSPNPNNTDAFLLSDDVQGETLEIMTLTGQRLWRMTVTARLVEHPALPPGIYLVQLADARGLRRRSMKLVQE